MKPFRTLQDVIIDDLKRENVDLIELAKVAGCPCCDGSGAYYDGYGDACQCQWCDEFKIIKERKR